MLRGRVPIAYLVAPVGPENKRDATDFDVLAAREMAIDFSLTPSVLRGTRLFVPFVKPMRC